MESRKIVDAAHLRVIAHPTRLRLLGLLRELGPQTAASLSSHVDEAPGTLSYHLNKLADAGFIEEDERPDADRRERWWRASHEQTAWDDADLIDDPEKLAAALDFVRIVGHNYARQYESYLAGASRLSSDWVDASTSGDRVLRLTAAELAELRDDFAAIDHKWKSVSDSHGDGDGAEQVIVVVQAYRRPQ